jgi:hypothetical protein
MADQFTPPAEPAAGAGAGAGAGSARAGSAGALLAAGVAELDPVAAGAGAAAGMAALAARASHGATVPEAGSVSRWPAEISDGFFTWCRLAHHTAGQSAARPYSCAAIADSVSPACTV